jgi:pantoate--beta-alanine ligase
MPNEATLSKPMLVSRRAELRDALDAARAAGKTIGLVPTMGALHAGHLSLVDAATRECDYTIATIFVNPTQFGAGEDFGRYPRDLDGDVEKLGERGVDLVFAPDTGEIYGASHATKVVVGSVAHPLEGQFRPGHFEGVATVVLKLFNLVPADAAYFGQKDYQQSLVVRRMVEDLDVPIQIRICPIVRDADGLALSSRNQYLSADERRQALSLSASLRLAEQLVHAGQRDAGPIIRQMRELIHAAGDVRIDYVAICDPDTLSAVAVVDRPVVVLTAVRVGNTRLIDNAMIASL